jgi:hypothetical protein
MSRTPLRLSVLSLLLALAAPAASAQWLESSTQTILEVKSAMAQDSFGWTAASVGDVTGDGVDDIVTCAPLDGTTQSAAGMVGVYSGADGSNVWQSYGGFTSAILGYALEVYDWNEDGTLDVLAGAPFTSVTGGSVFVYDAADGTVLHTFTPVSGSIESFGTSIAVGHDFDGDGTNDVAVGSIGYDHSGFNRAGRVTVFSGLDSSLITTIDGPYDDAEFGIALAFLGDVSVPPDGRAELVAGHRDATFWDGSALVYSWDGTAAVQLYEVAGVGMGYNLLGDRIDGGFDLDGDGRGDFLVGDRYLSTIDVFSGVDGSLIHTLTGDGPSGSFGSAHFTPDVDGDGVPDVIAGDTSVDAGALDGGRVYLYSGATGSLLRTMTYAKPTRRIGIDARWIGDHDGDGVDDFVVSGMGGSGLGPPRGRFVIVRGNDLAATYCTAGVSASGCRAFLSGSGTASATAPSGFDLTASGVEGDKGGIFFFGTSGRQASPWGNGTSLQCVVPPVKRTPALIAAGTPGVCDGFFLLDLHARWTAQPKQNPGPGAVVQAQLWYRDPFNTSNQTTSLSSAIEFPVGP